MQSVVETAQFQRSAAHAGMKEQEVAHLIDLLAAQPDLGDEIKGTGGCRKLRLAGRGKGKSGGYRVITFFSGPSIPVFLLYAYSKADRSDLDGAQREVLKKLTKALSDEYGKKPARRVR